MESKYLQKYKIIEKKFQKFKRNFIKYYFNYKENTKIEFLSEENQELYNYAIIVVRLFEIGFDFFRKRT